MTAHSTPASSDAGDLVILVDSNDEAIGYDSKQSCHDHQGRLHRAFSVFLFDEHGRVLLQQRSPRKRLWGGYWSNSCCSHPRPGESIAAASARRVREELGLTTSTTFLFSFEYRASFSDLGSEHELCHVVVGSMPHAPAYAEDEISDCRLCTPESLDRELLANPGSFTPWLLLEWPTIRARHWRDVRRLCGSGEALR